MKPMPGTSMPTVGFVLNGAGPNWVGGSNYLSNLLLALDGLQSPRISTTLIAAPSLTEHDLKRFPASRVIRSDMFMPRSPRRLLGKLSERVLARNLPIEYFCRHHAIDILSHVTPLGRRSAVPTIAWIPDFQERYLPAFFSADELARRAAGYRQIADQATMVILSSEDARSDLLTLYPEIADRTRVLHFAAGFGERHEVGRAADIIEKYRLPTRYFHLPNQLWAHKNHVVAIEAVRLLQARGVEGTIVCTGHLEDYRNPDFYRTITAKIADSGVGDRFRIEGLVPYGDVQALLAHSIAVINPSLFEGWSTTVEEAKSLGKRVLLSDIAVHREQAPARGTFFATDDPAALASQMEAALASHDPDEEDREARRSSTLLPGRVQEFARHYEQIVLDTLAIP